MSFLIQIGWRPEARSQQGYFSIGAGVCQPLLEPQNAGYFASQVCEGADLLWFDGDRPSLRLWAKSDTWLSLAGVASIHGGPSAGLVIGKSYANAVFAQADPAVPVHLFFGLDGAASLLGLEYAVRGGLTGSFYNHPALTDYLKEEFALTPPWDGKPSFDWRADSSRAFGFNTTALHLLKGAVATSPADAGEK